MEIPEFYSDHDFQFQNILLNPDVINAFKLRTAIFLDPETTSRDELDQAEHDFVQDLAKMIELYGKGSSKPASEDAQLNKIFQHCLGLKIRLLENVHQSMPTLKHEQNDLLLYSLLNNKLKEVKYF